MRNRWTLRAGRGEEQRPEPALGAGGFRVVVGAQVLAVTAAAVLGAVVIRDRGPAPAAPARMRSFWPERAAALEAQLRERPGDPTLRMRLASVRIGAELQEAQRTFPGDDAWSDLGNERYRRYLTACLEASPRVAESEATLREVARTAPRRQLRARAWASLALLYSLTGAERERLESLMAACREDPQAEFRRTVELLRRRPLHDGVLD